MAATYISAYDISDSDLLGEGTLPEILLAAVYQTDPTECPLAQSLPRVPVRGPVVQWNRVKLPTVSTTPVVAGKVWGNSGTYTAVLPKRLINYTSIIDAEISVDDSVLAYQQTGIADEMAFQVGQWSKAWAIAQAGLLYDPTITPSVGSSGAGAVLKNIPYLINAGESESEIGSPTLHTTVAGAGTGVDTLTEDEFNDGLQNHWNNGGKATTLFLDPNLMRTIQATFVGLAKAVDTGDGVAAAPANQRLTQAADGGIYANVRFYLSPFGQRIAFVVDRRIPVRDGVTWNYQDTRAFLLDRNFLSIGVCRELRPVEMSKDGDRSNTLLVGEFTLIMQTEKAHYEYRGLTA